MSLGSGGSGSDSDEELREAVALAGPGTFAEAARRPRPYDADGLLAKVAELSNGLEWPERLDVSCEPAPAPPGTDMDFDTDDVRPDDDLRRELLFYRIAQSGVVEGLRRLRAAGVPTRRPDDYLAEMVKTDAHMAKVRSSLVARQRELETREKAKALRQQKKFAKQAQHEALLKKQQEKRSFNEALKKVKKGQSASEDLEDILGGSRKRQAPPKEAAAAAKKAKGSKKREYKNQKWGFGGQKKRAKYNTQQSAKSFKGFDTKKHAAVPKKAQQLVKNKNKKRGRRR